MFFFDFDSRLRSLRLAFFSAPAPDYRVSDFSTSTFKFFSTLAPESDSRVLSLTRSPDFDSGVPVFLSPTIDSDFGLPVFLTPTPDSESGV